MTRIEFIVICEGHLIDPAIALENEAVREALGNKVSADELGRILSEQF